MEVFRSIEKGSGARRRDVMAPSSQSHGSPPLSEEEAGRLQRKLEKAVLSVCPAHLADRREDLVQEALIKVVQILRERPAGTELNATYLWRTAYCALVDELRVLRRRGEVPLGGDGDEDGPAITLVSPEPGPGRSGTGAEIRRALAHCLERLAESRRLAVILHLQGESATEAGEILGWATKKIYNLTFRGLQDLRKCLRGQGVTP
jgi:RNA polymerase sigma-70 factor (ECF subfamily)